MISWRCVPRRSWRPCRIQSSRRSAHVRRRPLRRSVVGKSRERLLRRSVPPQSRDGMLPSTLHGLESAPMRLIAARDRLFQMGILRLDDFIGLGSTEPGITRPTHLSAGHRLHSGDARSGAAFGASRFLLIRDVRPTPSRGRVLGVIAVTHTSGRRRSRGQRDEGVVLRSRTLSGMPAGSGRWSLRAANSATWTAPRSSAGHRASGHRGLARALAACRIVA